MLNSLPVTPVARQPRALVKINGDIIPGAVSFEVENNTFYAADTFHIVFALSLLPNDKNSAWWAIQQEITVEILAGFPADPDHYTSAELHSLIYGRVDDVRFDPVGRRIEISGRDMTAAFIDAKTTEKWVNQTSSSIATALAFRHELSVQYITQTQRKVGEYYKYDHARMTNQQTEWDLLTYLAHEEQFDVYVKGNELHFEPQTNAATEAYMLQWEEPTDDRGSPSFNGKSIEFSRNLTLAKGVVVTVRSWNSANGKAFTVSYPTNKAKGTAPGKASPVAQVFPYTIPGLTPEQALQKAQALHQEITMHEVKLTATMPADNLLDVKTLIQVNGTGTAFDQLYYPDSVTRSMSIQEGYVMRISAKNHSPESVVPA